MDIAEPSEEWLTSAQALGLARRTGDVRVMPWDRDRGAPTGAGRAMTSPQRPTASTRPPVAGARSQARGGRPSQNGHRPRDRETELEYEF